jgi:hypothetical protein
MVVAEARQRCAQCLDMVALGLLLRELRQRTRRAREIRVRLQGGIEFELCRIRVAQLHFGQADQVADRRRIPAEPARRAEQAQGRFGLHVVGHHLAELRQRGRPA